MDSLLKKIVNLGLNLVSDGEPGKTKDHIHHQIIVYHNLAKTWKAVGTRTWYNVEEVDKIKGGKVLWLRN